MDSGSPLPEGDDEAVPDRFRVDFVGRTLLGTYEVERRLAEGGMGTVYLARDRSLGRRVVVKVPHARFLSEPGFRSRFRREIAELVRLEHAHVVRILARGEEDDVPYFVLPYLGGGSLEDVLREGPQSIEEATRWLVPIASTLDFVHARGVVHRDVKPGNILFDEQRHVLLSDFGVVKALEREEEGALTDLGTAVGSPFYMAPEQALGKEVGPAADQYALASTLYEALAGEPPFGKGTPVEVVIRKQQGRPTPVRERRPETPAAADDVLARALDPDPAARFPDCGTFARAFVAAVAPPAPAAAPPGRRGRLAALAVLAVGLVAGTAVGAATDWFGLARAVEAPTPPARPASNVVLVEPGSEPRRVLRYRPEVGAQDRFVLRFEDSTTREVAGREVESGSVRDQDATVRVDSVADDGTARVAWRFSKFRVTHREGTPEALVAEERRIFESLGEVDLVSTRAGNGAGEVRIDRPEGPALAAAIEAGAEEFVRQLEVELPVDPVGVGAVWDHARFARYLGMRFHESATYELVEADGDRLRLRYQMQQHAPDQKMLLPGEKEGPATEIEEFRASGRGEIVLDLTRPAPLEHAAKGTVEFTGRLVGFPLDGTVIRVETAFEVRLVRE
jgi:hypothetical protein